MNKKQINELFGRIKNHYNTFTISESKIEEWQKFLKDYDSKEVNNALDTYLTNDYDNPPLVYHLIRNLKKLETIEDNSWVTECDLCKQRFRIYNNDMSEYEKHFRKCSKIDFIDRMSVKFRGKHVALSKYYEMNDDELNSVYRKIMDFYLKNRQTVGFIKEMPID